MHLEICWCKGRGARHHFPSSLGRVCASLKPGSTLLCDLSMASFWRSWQKEAPATIPHVLPHQTKSSGRKNPEVALEWLSDIVGCRLRILADQQPAAWGLVSRAEMSSSAHLFSPWCSSSKAWGHPLWYFSFPLCRQHGIISRIMTKNIFSSWSGSRMMGKPLYLSSLYLVSLSVKW